MLLPDHEIEANIKDGVIGLEPFDATVARRNTELDCVKRDREIQRLRAEYEAAIKSYWNAEDIISRVRAVLDMWGDNRWVCASDLRTALDGEDA